MVTFRPWGEWRRSIVAVAVVAVGIMVPSAAYGDSGVPVPPDDLLLNGRGGAVSEVDRDFVVKVRLAGLWEIPAGQMAEQKSRNPRIRSIGRNIAAQHVTLDRLDRAAAAALKIDLPNTPNKDQQSWLGEMRDAEGDQFDQIYIDRLRAAHGKIFPAIAAVRASTRNDTVRKLAQQANQFVMTHMTLLESSDLVNFDSLPAAASSASPSPAPPDARTLAASTAPQSSGTSVVIIAIILVGAVVAAFLLGRRVTTVGRPASRRRRRVADYGDSDYF